VWQDLEIDIILGEYRGILAETQCVQPPRHVGHGSRAARRGRAFPNTAEAPECASRYSVLLGSTSVYAHSLFGALDGAQPSGSDGCLESFDDTSEQPRPQKSIIEALGLGTRHWTKVRAGPDKAVDFAYHSQ
jgi:hypothetical protein